MTIKKVVEALRAQGHKVKVYVRPDGGQRITKIDGLKFSVSGNEGNDFGRGLIGDTLTKKQYEQRRTIQPLAQEGKQATITPFYVNKKGRKVTRKNAKKPQSLTIRKGDTAQEKAIKRRIRKLRKKLKEHGQKTTAKILRGRIKRYGLEDTLKVLANKTRKDAGIAYPASVESYEDYLIMVQGRYGYASLDSLVRNVTSVLELNKRRLADFLFSGDMSRGIYPIIYEVEKICKDWQASGQEGEPSLVGYEDEILRRIQQSRAEAEAIAQAWGLDLDND